MGDFNAHHVAWGNKTCDLVGKRLLDVFVDSGFNLLNDKKSSFCRFNFVPSSASVSVIDLILASPSVSHLCNSCSTLSDPMGSDHFPISVVVRGTRPNHVAFKYKIKLSDKAIINLHSVMEKNFDISKYIINSDLEESYNSFTKDIISQIKSVTSRPSFATSTIVKKSRNPAPWWNNVCSEAILNRNNAFIKFKTCMSKESFILYKRETAIYAVRSLTSKKGWDGLIYVLPLIIKLLLRKFGL